MKTLKKTAILIAALCMLTALFASCAKKPEKKGADDPVRVLTLKGPTGLGMVELMNENANGKSSLKYEFTVCGSPDEVKTEILAGRFDIAAVPINLAAALYNKTGGEVRIAAVNTLGVLYILERGNTINSAADLKGKTIGATGEGSTPEYVLNYILRANGLEPGVDVTVEYYAEHEELAKRIIGGMCDIGMLPQPNVTAVLTKKSDVRIALDLTEEWEKADASGSALAQGCVVVSKTFAEKYPDLLEAFLEEYRLSAEFANADPEKAGEYSARFGVVPDASVAAAAIPKCNICFFAGEEMKTKAAGMLGVLFNADPKSVGGKLPGDDFYYGVK